MEYVQERVATLHDLADADPDAPTDRAAVVVPMTDREYGGLAPERVLSELETLDVARVVVPLRAPAERVPDIVDWLDAYDLPLQFLWCNGPDVGDLLDAHGLENGFGKGRDVWLALGVAAQEADYVVVHDADAKNYTARHVRRLLAPLAGGFDFVKGYYARIENNQLYGRLNRLFYEPLVRALADAHDDPIVDYLGAFRYALAGEFAVTSDLARSMRAQRDWGLEVGALGEAFAHAGFERSAQVDLGRHEHDHRAVSGPTGLTEMSEAVGAACFHVLADHGCTPDFEALADRYRTTAVTFVDAYAADAAFNDLDYDPQAERDQVQAYADAIAPPGEDRRLPPWTDVPFAPADVLAASRSAVASRGQH